MGDADKYLIGLCLIVYAALGFNYGQNLKKKKVILSQTQSN